MNRLPTTRTQFVSRMASGLLIGSFLVFCLDRYLLGRWNWFFAVLLLFSAIVASLLLFAVFPYVPESLMKLRHSDRMSERKLIR